MNWQHWDSNPKFAHSESHALSIQPPCLTCVTKLLGGFTHRYIDTHVRTFCFFFSTDILGFMKPWVVHWGTSWSHWGLHTHPGTFQFFFWQIWGRALRGCGDVQFIKKNTSSENYMKCQNVHRKLIFTSIPHHDVHWVKIFSWSHLHRKWLYNISP